jgi:hypothetical protein
MLTPHHIQLRTFPAPRRFPAARSIRRPIDADRIKVIWQSELYAARDERADRGRRDQMSQGATFILKDLEVSRDQSSKWQSAAELARLANISAFVARRAHVADPLQVKKQPRAERTGKGHKWLSRRKSVITLGVDIGLHGAIALIDESGEFIAVHDMPRLADGPKRAHAVRWHWRKDFRRPGERIWIRDHERGVRSLGFVTHDYVEVPSPRGAS